MRRRSFPRRSWLVEGASGIGRGRVGGVSGVGYGALFCLDARPGKTSPRRSRAGEGAGKRSRRGAATRRLRRQPSRRGLGPRLPPRALPPKGCEGLRPVISAPAADSAAISCKRRCSIPFWHAGRFGSFGKKTRMPSSGMNCRGRLNTIRPMLLSVRSAVFGAHLLSQLLM
jgi:hypothetical protein